jgi:hypothetical protein
MTAIEIGALSSEDASWFIEAVHTAFAEITTKAILL